MQGGLAWRYLLPHLLYELLAVGGSVLRGQGLAALRAKCDFLRHVSWVRGERVKLAAQLDRTGGVRAGARRLAERLPPWWRGFTEPRHAAKLRRRPAVPGGSN
jgi:hypothetical protein